MVYVDPEASTNTDAVETSVADCAPPGDESTTRGATSPLDVGVTVYVTYPALGPVPVYPVIVAAAEPTKTWIEDMPSSSRFGPESTSVDENGAPTAV
jgi:hypothetical protein